MLDKLKDIVPEVDESKAKLIYQKSKTSKSRVSFNYKLVLRFACLLIVLIPVLVIIGLSGKNGNVFEPNAPSFNGSATNKPGNEDAGDVHEYFYYNVYYEIIWLKQCSSQIVIFREFIITFNRHS